MDIPRFSNEVPVETHPNLVGIDDWESATQSDPAWKFNTLDLHQYDATKLTTNYPTLDTAEDVFNSSALLALDVDLISGLPYHNSFQHADHQLMSLPITETPEIQRIGCLDSDAQDTFRFQSGAVVVEDKSNTPIAQR